MGMPFEKAQAVAAKGATFMKKSNWYTTSKRRIFYVQPGSLDRYVLYFKETDERSGPPRGWFSMKEVEEGLFDRITGTMRLLANKRGVPKIRILTRVPQEFMDALL